MATTPPDLAKLLTALRAARDPWSRLKLVTAGARQLSRLTARERRELLRKVGLEGAEEIADLAAGGNPEAAEALDATLRWLEGNPQELQQFVRDRLESAARDLGWAPQRNEGDLVKELRSDILRALGSYHTPATR